MPNKTEFTWQFVPLKQNQVWTQDPLAAEPATNMNAFCKYFFVFAGH